MEVEITFAGPRDRLLTDVPQEFRQIAEMYPLGQPIMYLDNIYWVLGYVQTQNDVLLLASWINPSQDSEGAHASSEWINPEEI